MADEVKTEDAAPTQPYKGLHRSKGIAALCGWAIIVFFCCCSGETELPMPTTASNGKVQCVMPITTMKFAEIEQREYDEFYKSTTSMEIQLRMPIVSVLTKSLLTLMVNVSISPKKYSSSICSR